MHSKGAVYEVIMTVTAEQDMSKQPCGVHLIVSQAATASSPLATNLASEEHVAQVAFPAHAYAPV